ncbi:MAG TPA: DUF1573 domain-containing protein [Pirellulales bacterium]|nr:DUF1573 domain-containing protein [Pirellulales bacterium]
MSRIIIIVSLILSTSAGAFLFSDMFRSLVGRPSLAPSAPPKFLLEELDPATNDFGVLTRGIRAEHQFRFRNVTDHPIRLSRGRATCGCVNSRLAPPEVLEPWADGTLTLGLSTEIVKHSGHVAEFLIVTAAPLATPGDDNAPETHKFTLAGFFEGLDSISGPIVIRGVSNSLQPPPLRLYLMSVVRDADLQLLSVESPFPWVAAVISRSEVDPPISDGQYYRRSVTVPLQSQGDWRPGKGEFAIRYRLGTAEHTLRLDAYALGPPP